VEEVGSPSEISCNFWSTILIYEVKGIDLSFVIYHLSLSFCEINQREVQDAERTV
jgi:hypothetical protein